MAEPTNRSNQPPPPNNQDGIGLPTPAPAPPSSVSPDPKNDTSLEKFFAEIDKLKDSVAKTNELLEQQAALQKAIAEMQNSTDESSLKSKKEELVSGEKSYDETRKSLDEIVKTLDAEKKSREELVVTLAQLKDDIRQTKPESEEEADNALAEALGETKEEPSISRKENIAALLQSSNAQQVALNTSIETMREMKDSDAAIEADIDKQTRFAEEEKMRKVGSPLTPGEAATLKLLKEDNSLLKKIRDLLDTSILSKIFKLAIFGLLVLTGIIIYKYFPKILEFVKGLKDKIVDFVKNFDWEKTWEWLKTIPEKIVNALKSIQDKIVSAYEYLTTRGFKGIMTDLKDGLYGFLTDWGQYIWGAIRDAIKDALTWYGKELILAAGTALTTGAGMITSAIWDGVVWLAGAIKDGVSYVLQKIVAFNAIYGVLKALYGIFTGTAKFTDLFRAIGSGYIGALGGQFANTLTKAFGPMFETAGVSANMFSRIAETISGFFSAAASGTGFIGKIFGPIVSVITRISPFLSTALSYFVKYLPIVGWVLLAWDAIKGAIMGFTKDGIAGAIKGLIANVLAGLTFGLLSFDQIYGWIDSAINWVAEGLVVMWDGITSLISSMGSWISTGLSSMWDGVVNLFADVGNAFMNFGWFLFSVPGKILSFITSIAATLLKKVIDILPDWAVPDTVAKFITDLTRVPKEGSSIASAPSGAKVVAIISPPKMTTNQKILLEQTEDEKRFLDSMSSDGGMKERLRRQMEVGYSVAANTLNTAMSSNNLAKMAKTAATTVINAPTNNVVGGGSNSGPMAIPATNNRNTDPTVRALSFSESPAM